MTALRRLSRPVIALTLALGFALVLSDGAAAQTPAGEFHFAHFFERNLARAGRFSIRAVGGPRPGQAIGSGEILEINARTLRLRFEIPGAANGEVHLRYLDLQNGRHRIALEFRGGAVGSPTRLRETVYADDFLTRGKILALRFNRERYFLQISVNARGETRLVTNWGAGRLTPRP